MRVATPKGLAAHLRMESARPWPSAFNELLIKGGNLNSHVFMVAPDLYRHSNSNLMERRMSCRSGVKGQP